MTPGLYFLLGIVACWLIVNRAYRHALRREVEGVSNNIGARGLR